MYHQELMRAEGPHELLVSLKSGTMKMLVYNIGHTNDCRCTNHPVLLFMPAHLNVYILGPSQYNSNVMGVYTELLYQVFVYADNGFY